MVATAAVVDAQAGGSTGGRKAAKDRGSAVKKTLDVHHTARVEHMNKAVEQAASKRAQLQRLAEQIAQLRAEHHETRSEELLEELLQLQDQHYALDAEVRRLEAQNDELKYILDAGDILFKYYDIVENGQPAAAPTAAPAPLPAAAVSATAGAPSARARPPQKQSILAWFQGPPAPPAGAADAAPSACSGAADVPAARAPARKSLEQQARGSSPCQPPPDSGKQPLPENKAALIERYMAVTQGSFVPRGGSAAGASSTHGSAQGARGEPEAGGGACCYCNSQQLTVMANEGYMYCNECATMEYVVMDHDKPSYKDPPKEISYWAYKRINHFNEWLNQTQARQSTEIPEELYDRILLEIKKQRITNMAELSPDKVKEILKKLKGDARKYYEHIPFIIHRLNGRSMPHFSPELEEQLRSMFRAIQVPFSRAVLRVCAERKNFLSYSFVLHKFMQLLGLDEYVHIFKLLRSREKLHQQDQIWKIICEELNWEFVPSL